MLFPETNSVRLSYLFILYVFIFTARLLCMNLYLCDNGREETHFEKEVTHERLDETLIDPCGHR